MVNNIRNNTISEIDAKKNLNTLNKIKNAEIIKDKRRTTKHKELLNLFNGLLDTILTDKTESESQEDKNKNENEKVGSIKVESKKEENENKDENEDDYENEDDFENEDKMKIKMKQ